MAMLPDQHKQFYSTMVRIRTFEEIAVDVFRAGKIPGFIHTYVGEEAFDHLDAPIERVAAADVPIPFSPPMEQFVIPHTDDILQAVRRAVAGIR